MTDIETALAAISAELDDIIREHITDLWLRIEADSAATMPADGMPLDAGNEIGAWHRISVADLVAQERHRLEALKADTLARCRRQIEAEGMR